MASSCRFDMLTNQLEEEVLDIILDKNTSHTNVFQTFAPCMARMGKEDMPLVYNRINKAGSTSMLRLLQELAFQNNFILLSKGLPKVGVKLDLKIYACIRNYKILKKK